MMNAYLCDFHHVFELKKRYSQFETIFPFFDLKLCGFRKIYYVCKKITGVILQLLYKEIYAETNDNNPRSNYRNSF